jgi:hypothetical protein
MRDWDQFVQHTPWFTDPGDIIVVGDQFPWPRGRIGSLPRLSSLLQAASLTNVSVSGTPYELIA